MRILGIETTTRRGSIALVENNEVVLSAEYEELHAHAERMLPLLNGLMAQAGWARTSVDRVGVGVGPGSFTGLRVGIALGQGIAIGIDVPILGVVSLQAMAFAVPSSRKGTRWALLDARRDEIFVAAYAPDQSLVLQPRAAKRSDVGQLIASVSCGDAEAVALGEVTSVLEFSCQCISTPRTDLPHAMDVALLGARLAPEEAPAQPQYVRDADALLPTLPPSPLIQPRN